MPVETKCDEVKMTEAVDSFRLSICSLRTHLLFRHPNIISLVNEFGLECGALAGATVVVPNGPLHPQAATRQRRTDAEIAQRVLV